MDGGPDATTSLKTPGVKPRPGAAPPGRSPSRGAFCLPGLPEHHPRQPREAPDLAARGTTRSLAGFPQRAVGGRNAQTLLDGDGMSSSGTARSGSRENPGALCPAADPAWRAWRDRGCQGMPPHRSRGPAVRSATRVLPGARLALASPGPQARAWPRGRPICQEKGTAPVTRTPSPPTPARPLFPDTALRPSGKHADCHQRPSSLGPAGGHGRPAAPRPAPPRPPPLPRSPGADCGGGAGSHRVESGVRKETQELCLWEEEAPALGVWAGSRGLASGGLRVRSPGSGGPGSQGLVCGGPGAGVSGSGL